MCYHAAYHTTHEWSLQRSTTEQPTHPVCCATTHAVVTWCAGQCSRPTSSTIMESSIAQHANMRYGACDYNMSYLNISSSICVGVKKINTYITRITNNMNPTSHIQHIYQLIQYRGKHNKYLYLYEHK